MATMENTADSRDLQAATQRLREGGVVLFPTETYYGLGADPRQPAAVEALRSIKGRAAGHALPLLAGNWAQVGAVAPGWEACPAARVLAERFWPGPLALVLQAGPDLAPGVAADDGSVAIRWSSHRMAVSLAQALGYPLIATSANRSGRPPRCLAEQAAADLGAGLDLLVVDGGPTPGGAASTLVLPAAERVQVLREGAIVRSRLEHTLAEVGVALE